MSTAIRLTKDQRATLRRLKAIHSGRLLSHPDRLIEDAFTRGVRSERSMIAKVIESMSIATPEVRTALADYIRMGNGPVDSPKGH